MMMQTKTTTPTTPMPLLSKVVWRSGGAQRQRHGYPIREPATGGWGDQKDEHGRSYKDERNGTKHSDSKVDKDDSCIVIDPLSR